MSNTNSSRTGLSIREIQETVALAFNLTVREMVSPSRRRDVTRARHVAMYLSRELAGHCAVNRAAAASFPRIGRAFARNHTSVIHACSAMRRRLGDDAVLASLLIRLEGALADSMTNAKAEVL